MYCAKCGKKVDDDAKFCIFCGKMLSSAGKVVFENVLTVRGKAMNI